MHLRHWIYIYIISRIYCERRKQWLSWFEIRCFPSFEAKVFVALATICQNGCRPLNRTPSQYMYKTVAGTSYGGTPFLFSCISAHCFFLLFFLLFFFSSKVIYTELLIMWNVLLYSLFPFFCYEDTCELNLQMQFQTICL